MKERLIIVAIIIIIILLVVSILNITHVDRDNNNQKLLETGAYYGISSEIHPISYPEISELSPFNSSNYESIELSDDNRVHCGSINNTTQVGYPLQLFVVDTDLEKIDQITIEWEGFGNSPRGYEMVMFIWDFTNSSWIELITFYEHPINLSRINNTPDIWFNISLYNDIININRYYGNENNIAIMVMGPEGIGKSNSALNTDFFKVKVQ